MTTEMEYLGASIWLRQELESGRARELVRAAGLSTGSLAKQIGCSQPNAWRYLAGRQFPRRSIALRLVQFLRMLEVAVDD